MVQFLTASEFVWVRKSNNLVSKVLHKSYATNYRQVNTLIFVIIMCEYVIFSKVIQKKKIEPNCQGTSVS